MELLLKLGDEMASVLTMSPFIKGFGLGGSLIIAIGSQNAYLIRQGLKKEHVFWIATVCFLCDALLISLGAGGVGSLIDQSPLLLSITRWGGAAFLFLYGLQAFRSALKPSVLDSSDTGEKMKTRNKAMLTALALSLLNPHALLDTFVLIGGIAGHMPTHARWMFALGTLTTSFIWFYGVAFGAKKLAPVFANPKAWQVLDTIIGCMMWTIASTLIFMKL